MNFERKISHHTRRFLASLFCAERASLFVSEIRSFRTDNYPHVAFKLPKYLCHSNSLL